MSDQAIEQEIRAKGLTAPRITPADIEANIVSEHYFTARDGAEAVASGGGSYSVSLGLLSFCVLVLKNGFTVTGESACASPENFDTGVGSKIARANAINKVWPLMGYHLKQQLHEQEQAAADVPTHICKECGAQWRLYQHDIHTDSGPTWSLRSRACGSCCDNVTMGTQLHQLLPHQQRVVVESNELNERLQKLAAFIDGEAFKDIPGDERARLIAQAGAMGGYLTVLQERIAHFPKQEQ